MDTFEVEEVLNEAVTDGVLFYRVKWKGFDDEKDITWENASNLRNCQDAIRKYSESKSNCSMVYKKIASQLITCTHRIEICTKPAQS